MHCVAPWPKAAFYYGYQRCTAASPNSTFVHVATFRNATYRRRGTGRHDDMANESVNFFASNVVSKPRGRGFPTISAKLWSSDRMQKHSVEIENLASD